MPKTFLQEYVFSHENTEIPRLFSLWCGLFGVSSVLGRRVSLDLGTFRIYPNLYVILVAGSGRCRKSTAVRQISRLLRDAVKLNLISQKLTPQALVEAMNDLPEGILFQPDKQSEGVIIVDEMANFLNKSSYEAGMAPMLISFYDCEDYFEYRTKGRGKETVTNSCLNVLAATTIDWLREGIPADAVGGGLTSRMLFVYVDTPNPPVPFPVISAEQKEAHTRAGLELLRFSNLSGEYTLSPEAKTFYEEEYCKFYTTSSMYEHAQLSGYASRRGVHILKLALLLCVINSTSNVISIDHITKARDLLMVTEEALPSLLRTIVTTEVGNNAELVLSIISRNRSISRSDLLRKVSHKLDARGLNEVLNTLTGSGVVKAVEIAGATYYIPS